MTAYNGEKRLYFDGFAPIFDENFAREHGRLLGRQRSCPEDFAVIHVIRLALLVFPVVIILIFVLVSLYLRIRIPNACKIKIFLFT